MVAINLIPLKESFNVLTKAAAAKPIEKEILDQTRLTLTVWLDNFIRALYMDEDFENLQQVQTPYFRQKISLLLSERERSRILAASRTKEIINDTLLRLFEDENEVKEELSDKEEIRVRAICKLLIADLLGQTYSTLSSERASDYTNYIRARFNKLPIHYFENSLKHAFSKETDPEKKEFILDTLSGRIAAKILNDKAYIDSIVKFINDNDKTDWQKYFLGMGTIPSNRDLLKLVVKTLANSELSDEARVNTYKILSQFNEIPRIQGCELLDFAVKDLENNKIDLKLLLKIICLINSGDSNLGSPLHEASFEKLLKILEQRGNIEDVDTQNLLGLALVTLLRPTIGTDASRLEQIRSKARGNLSKILDTVLEAYKKPHEPLELKDEINNIGVEIKNANDIPALSLRIKAFARAISDNSSFFNLEQISSKTENDDAILERIKIKAKTGLAEFKELADKFAEKMFYCYADPYIDQQLKEAIQDSLIISGTDGLICVAAYLKSEEPSKLIKASLEFFDSLLATKFGKKIVRIHKSKSLAADTFNSKMELSDKAKKIFRKSIQEYPHVKAFFKANNIDYSLAT